MLANIIGMCLSTKHREHCLGFAVFWFNWANSLINTTINLNCSLLCCKVIIQITVHVNRIRTEMMSQKKNNSTCDRQDKYRFDDVL